MKMSGSRMGLGMAALGRPGYINLERADVFGDQNRSVEAMQKASEAVMSEAIKLGISWFDCARSYGMSEKFVGDYLRKDKIDPAKMLVSSKWGYTYVADWNVSLVEGKAHEIKDHSLQNFLKQLEETDELVGEYVKLYQIHSATFESGVLTDKQVHAALGNCKKERGWLIGLSVSSPRQDEIIREAMKIKDPSSATGEKLFDSIQCTYNLLEQSASGALMEAHEDGIDIIIKEGLANGRVLNNQHVIDASSRLSIAPDQLALAFILAQPFSPRVLSGAVSAEHIISNSKALDLFPNFSPGGEHYETMKHLMRTCSMSSEDYWKERASLVWN